MSTRRHKTLVEVAATLRGHRRVPDTTTKELLAKVAKLRVEGKNWREVGAALGREHTTVYRTVKRWPVEYERALRKLKRPIDRRAERLASRLENEEAYRRLELLRLDRAAGRAIDAVLESPNLSLKLRVANAVYDYLDQNLPERVLSFYRSAPVAHDTVLDTKRVAPLGEATDEPDDYFDELLTREEWVDELRFVIGTGNPVGDAILEAFSDKCTNEPDEEAFGDE